MAYTIPQIIDIAKVSQYLVTYAIQKGGLYGDGIDANWPRKLYIIRKDVEWLYDLDSSDVSNIFTANYLYALCGDFAFQAANIIDAGGGGSIVIPTTPTVSDFAFEYVRRITAADFTNGVEYQASWIAGYEVYVFWNNANRYLEIGTELKYNPTGFTVFIDDGSGSNSFNANTTNADVEMIVYKRFPLGLPVTPAEENPPIIIVYNLTDNTEIAAIDTSVYPNGTVIKFVIKPNGFNYTWAAQFVWNDRNPEQPGAIAVDTYSMYDFTVMVDELIAGDEALNISTTDNDFNNIITNFGISGVQFAEPAFTSVIESFTGTTDLSIILGHFPMTTRDQSFYLNAGLIEKSNVSIVGKVVTFTGFTRDIDDIIEAHYSY